MGISAFLPFAELLAPIIDRVIPDPKEAARLKADLQTAAIEADTALVQGQAQVITAEAEGNWLQRSWRPVLMYFLMFIIGFHMIIVPPLAVVLDVPMIELVGLSSVPREVWTLLIVGMGGYIGGRTLEKVMGK